MRRYPAKAVASNGLNYLTARHQAKALQAYSAPGFQSSPLFMVRIYRYLGLGYPGIREKLVCFSREWRS